MLIGERLGQVRESKHLSQGDIEKRTGLIRCYTSRVENGHTVPALETLEKFAHALEVPLYRLFYEGDEPQPLVLPQPKNDHLSSKEIQSAAEVARLFSKIKRKSDRNLMMVLMRKLAARAT
jgi:transcriptional regulator with XRE-family HTH domain